MPQNLNDMTSTQQMSINSDAALADTDMDSSGLGLIGLPPRVFPIARMRCHKDLRPITMRILPLAACQPHLFQLATTTMVIKTLSTVGAMTLTILP